MRGKGRRQVVTQKDETAGRLWDQAVELVLKAQADLAAAMLGTDPRYPLQQAKLRASEMGSVLSKLINRLNEGEKL